MFNGIENRFGETFCFVELCICALLSGITVIPLIFGGNYPNASRMVTTYQCHQGALPGGSFDGPGPSSGSKNV